MSFPSWKEFKEKLSKFQDKATEAQENFREHLGEFKENNPYVVQFLDTCIPILPHPLNEIAKVIWNSKENSPEDRTNAVLDYLKKIENNGEENYHRIAEQLSELNLKMAKENTLLSIKEIMITTGKIQGEKLEQILSAQTETKERLDRIEILLSKPEEDPITKKIGFNETKKLIRFLLKSPLYTHARSFEQIKERVKGINDEELQRVLVYSGALKFEYNEKEHWGLPEKNLKTLGFNEENKPKEILSKLKNDQDVPKNLVTLLLKNPNNKKRTFNLIKNKISGFKDDELRWILISVGAVSFRRIQDGAELWGLKDRNEDLL